MSIIHILTDELINQIAAGEIIERPASIIKELVENAIDANSNKINIFVQNAGKTKIVIEDNGNGMSVEDLALSVKRYATSKLNDNNLIGIMTYGFRGEALPSIAAVSNLKIESNGNEISVNFSKEKDIIKSNFENGTRVTVSDLFDRLPARLKFLKSDNIELTHCISVIENFALTQPTIEFYLRDDKKILCNFNNNSLENRISEIIGKDLFSRAIHISEGNDIIKLDGYLFHPMDSKYSQSTQKIFINNRAVKDKIVSSAIKNSYKDIIPAGRFALCVLFITINPFYLDVNVSPTKSEIRFRDNNYVQKFIIDSIKKNLKKFDRISLMVDNSKLGFNDDGTYINKNVFDYTTIKRNDNKMQLHDITRINTDVMPLSDISKINTDETLHSKTQANPGNLHTNNINNDNNINNIISNLNINECETIPNFNTNINNKSDKLNKNKIENCINNQLKEQIILSNLIPDTIEYIINNDNNYIKDNYKEVKYLNNLELNKDHNIININDNNTLNFDNFNINKNNNNYESNIKNNLNNNKIDDNFFGEPIGQFMDTYIICKNQNELIIIDQHAVHEKIKMENIKSNLNKNNKQYLVNSIILKLNNKQLFIANSITKKLNDFGFILKIEEKNLIITAIPAILNDINIEQFFIDILDDDFNINEITIDDCIRMRIATTACHNSIRAGRKLSINEMKETIKEMQKTFSIHQCNHNRPSFIKITLQQLNNIFKRT